MLEIGMFLVDRYEILSKVGAGGMSDVYKAKDHILGRFVAIKELKQEFSEDINFVTKFRTEAQSAAGLEHPNIVNIYDVGSENGLHFIVMEYVEGITLKTYIEKKGQLSFKEATSIAIQVARGIESAHNKNITHRDIKPQNIIISTEGKVKVTDFGIAKAISSNTIGSDAMGSVHYASPEQARNGFIDGRSDIYSLGVVMYEMVTGRVPFDGETTVAVALQHLQEEMVAPSTYAPDLPISYERILLKATQKSPDRRYQDIAEMLADLRKALTNPNEDFVVIAPLVLGNTRVINNEELEEIQNASEEADLDSENGFVSEETEEEEDDNEDATGFLDPKMEKVVTIAGIAILALIVLIILFIIGSFVSDLFKFGSGKNPNPNPNTQQTESTEGVGNSEGTDQAEQVEMINIVGMDLEEARTKLQELGLFITVGSFQESDQEDGTILEQNEKEGSMVDKGSTITVIVAGTDGEMVQVPNVVGATESDAVSSLEAKGLLVTREFATSDEVEAGRVISQDPAEGEVEVGSHVTIVISEGRGKAMVPGGLVGKDIEEVRATLEGLGFVVNVIETTSDSYPTAGTVTKVAGAGTQKEIGSTIDVTVSTGPATVVPDTYKFSQTYTKDGATSYTYVLYDADGNEIKTETGTGSSVTVSKNGITTSSGKIVITWYGEVTTETPSDTDVDGDGDVDADDVIVTTETVEVGKVNETVTFVKE
ncbi:MAG: Stk1 family PASTA domain-containing Ser/Thr kinase [Agathobacter sp.]|nr:Stk1 family PASTA domain-containing Ser/Thr kinase [Agathobacter sp.]